MGIFNTRYLSKEQLQGFDNYKYSAVDTSPLAVYISHPFWNWLVNFYPLWIAPNLLTVCGWLMVMLGFVVVSFLDYDLNSNSLSESKSTLPIPNEVWLFCAICTFLGHTLDGTDGKQARRTGTSGPTGELFDHGLDSWSTVPFTVTIFSVFGRGEFSVNATHLLCILISVQIVFIVTHWEKYNTGILFLSWGYDASQYGLTAFYLLAYLVGYEWFKFYVFGELTFARCMEIGFYVCCVLSLLMSLYNIYKSYPNIYEACLPMLPAILLFSATLIWANYSPSILIERDPRSFFWTMGTVFSHIACRLIVAQMSHTRAAAINNLLIFYCIAVAVSVSGILTAIAELYFLRAVAVIVTVAHLHYGICVVRQLCRHFNIYAFSLSYLDTGKRRE
uniref:Ethanolaminephosphotransferase 1 n=1 Tax=Syphacia muris TaxID=451379 RepID=A0A0N5AU10_9BILA